MSRYSLESGRISSGVLIIRSRFVQKRVPTPISTRHTTPLAISVVYTAVFRSAIRLAPKSWETMTEQPMLQPKAKAIKIRVIS